MTAEWVTAHAPTFVGRHDPGHRAQRAPVPARLGAWVAANRAAVAVLSITCASALCLAFACVPQTDFHVYFDGARDLFSGDLYTHSYRGELFTYPPFAAVFFLPLQLLPGDTAAQVVWALLNEAALLGLLNVSIRANRPGLGARARLFWVLGLSLPATLLDPVLLGFRDGQVDLIVTLLVAWDLLGDRRLGGRTVPAGMASGVAAAIKLTPLVFVPYLLLTRRSRAAWCCAGTFVAAETLAFLVAPGASRAYWTHYLFDYKRLGGFQGLHGVLGSANQSLLGALTRLNHGEVPASLLTVVVVVVAVAGLVLAARVHARWSPVLGVILCATTGLLVSPVSWTHHMTWVIPAVAWLAVSPDRPTWGRPAAAGTAVLFLSAPVWWVSDEGTAPLHEGGWRMVAGNSFFLWMGLFVIMCGVTILGSGTRTPSTDGDSGRPTGTKVPTRPPVSLSPVHGPVPARHGRTAALDAPSFFL
ncbi:MAG TPA: glycosyltransferase 87 family protein [Acidimicrobiales bacterium]|nr:glycosyltransferase 87 family protein [Acidimicrobiales bacterium]